MTLAEILQNTHLLFGIAGIVITGIFAITKLTIKMKNYVDLTSKKVCDENLIKLEELKNYVEASFKRTDENQRQRYTAEAHSMSEVKQEITILKTQSALHDLRFHHLDEMLSEMRDDIKVLIKRGNE